jgi:hypothetical protein
VNETLRRIRRAINSIEDQDARAAAVAAFKEEFPEHYWSQHDSGRIDLTKGERVHRW